MQNADRLMLIIKALDPNASVLFSEYTHQWYVSASIEIGDGSMLTGGAEHRNTPNEAVEAFYDRLTSINLDQYVVSKYRGHRREWRWNGAAFAECTRDEALPKPLEPHYA
jgi:hypothetical protein